MAHYDYLRSRSDFIFLANATVEDGQIRCGLAHFGMAIKTPINLYDPKDQLIGRLKPPSEVEAIATSLTMTDNSDLIILDLLEV